MYLMLRFKSLLRARIKTDFNNRFWKKALYTIVLGLFCFASSALCYWQTAYVPLVDTSNSKNTTLKSVGLGNVTWTGGFWKSQQDICIQKIIPSMKEIMIGNQKSHFYENFLIALGEKPGKHRGAPWNDGDFYKWMEAVISSHLIQPSGELDQLMDDIISKIARLQRSDGYIHTPLLIEHLNGNHKAQPFEDRQNFETYNLGHLINLSCLHHRITGNKKFLNVGIKAADFLDVYFEKPSSDLARNAVCPSHYMALVELYRVTKNPKHLTLAKKLIALRDLMAGGGDDNQDRIPLKNHEEIAGHAVRANYLYAGVADLCLESNEIDYKPALEKVWESLAQKKIYITGACGALFDGASPDGSKDQKSIGKIHQAYGRNFQLPNSTAHNETCAAIGNVLWSWRMLLLTGDSKYSDMVERVLYNAVLSGVGQDGESYFYTNTLRQLDEMPSKLRWSRTRQKYISCFCCPPNLARLLSQIQGYACCVNEKGVWLNLYGSAKVNVPLVGGKSFAMTMSSEYPWNGNISICVDEAPDHETSVFFRIPEWADSSKIFVNNRETEIVASPGSYSRVAKKWVKGDLVELKLDWKPKWMESNPLVEENRNQVALVDGPIVYCLESSDLPAGKKIQKLMVPIPQVVKTEMIKEPWLNHPIKVIHMRFNEDNSKDWMNQLYRPYYPSKTSSFEARMIPYYAWSNRGNSEMSVWLPLGK